jgi:hypothetical protein
MNNERRGRDARPREEFLPAGRRLRVAIIGLRSCDAVVHAAVGTSWRASERIAVVYGLFNMTAVERPLRHVTDRPSRAARFGARTVEHVLR